MVKLFCPSCGAQLELDDSRDFGFCMYCGTKVMLTQKIKVEHAGSVELSNETNERKQLETARALFEAGNTEQARAITDALTKSAPHNAEAWLLYAKTLFAGATVFNMLFDNYERVRQIDTSIDSLVDIYVNGFTRSSAMETAKVLLGEDRQSLYHETVAWYEDRLRSECCNNAQRISNLLQDPTGLATYCIYKDCNNEFCPRGFFLHDGQLHFFDLGHVYLVHVQNDLLIFDLVAVTNGFLAKPYEFAHLQAKIIYVTDQCLILQPDKVERLYPFLYSSSEPNKLQVNYQTLVEHRKAEHLCPMCGGKLGFFGGCKLNCKDRITY